MKLSVLTIDTPQGPFGSLHRTCRYWLDCAQDPARAVALAMPPRSGGHAAQVLSPIFGQNRPEGYLLEHLGQRLKLRGAGDDDMRILHRQIERLVLRPPPDAGAQVADIIDQVEGETAPSCVVEHVSGPL